MIQIEHAYFDMENGVGFTVSPKGAHKAVRIPASFDLRQHHARSHVLLIDEVVKAINHALRIGSDSDATSVPQS